MVARGLQRSVLWLVLGLVTGLALAQTPARPSTSPSASPAPSPSPPPLALVVLPTVVDPTSEGLSTYRAAYDAALADELGRLTSLPVTSLAIGDLPAEYGNAIYASLQNPVQVARRLVESKKERFFVVSFISRPVNGALKITSWVFDQRSGRTIATGATSGPLDLSAGLRAEEVAAQVAEFLSPKALAALPTSFAVLSKTVALTKLVTFQSPQNGLQIGLPDGRQLGVIADGRLSLPLAVEIQGPLTIDLSFPGHYSDQRTYTIKDENPVIDLGELYPKRLWRVGLSWQFNLLSSGGASVLRFLDDQEYIFLEGDLNLFIKPLDSLSSTATYQQAAIYPELVAGVGSYVFLPPTAVVRTYFKTGVGMLLGLSTVAGSLVTTDLFLKPLVFGFEVNLVPFTISTEVYYRFYLGVFEQQRFAAGLIGDSPRLDYTVRLKL